MDDFMSQDVLPFTAFAVDKDRAWASATRKTRQHSMGICNYQLMSKYNVPKLAAWAFIIVSRRASSMQCITAMTVLFSECEKARQERSAARRPLSKPFEQWPLC